MQVSFSFPLPSGAAFYGLQLTCRKYFQYKAHQVSRQIFTGQSSHFNGMNCRFYSLRIDLSDTGFPTAEEESKQKKAAEKTNCQQKSLLVQKQADAQEFLLQAVKQDWLAGIQYHGKEVIRLTEEILKDSEKKEKEKV